MNVWLVKDGERFPLEAGQRFLRMSHLAEALRERGHSVVWWSSDHLHQTKECLFHQDTSLELEVGYRLELFHVGGYSGNRSLGRLVHHCRLALRMLAKMLKSKPPSLVVCSFPIIELVMACTVYCLWQRIPLVVDVRDTWPDAMLERFPQRFRTQAQVLAWPYQLAVRLTLARAKGLTAISETVLAWALKKARKARSPWDRVFVHGTEQGEVAHGSDNLFLAKLFEKLEGKIVFSFVGAFGPYYDLETLCRVARNLQRDGEHRIHFVLAGDGPTLTNLKEISRDLDNVSFVGWLERPQLNYLLSRSQVGLAPYVGDFFGNKVFEYLAFGVPLIVSESAELRDLVEELQVGLSYMTGDEHGMLRVVRTLLDDRELRLAMSERARAIFKQRFHSKIVYRQFAVFLEEIGVHQNSSLRFG